MDDLTIRRSAARLRIGVITAFALVLGLILCGRLGLSIGRAHVLLQSRFPGSSSVFQTDDGILLLLGVAIYWLTEALRSVAAGGLFSRVVVRRFRLFALWMLLAALFSALAPTIIAAFADSPPGRHRVMLVADVRDLLLISLTLLLFLIARMFERARAIEDEMSEIV
jgi:hypothetical protein